LEEVQDPKYHFPLKNDTLHSMLHPNLDDLKLLQMSLDHEFLKLKPKEKRLTISMNVSDVDIKDHQQDHQLLLLLNGPISEAVELVLVQVQRTHLEEGEQEELDFHPHCHHIKKKLDHKKENMMNMDRRPKKAQPSN
jgi:hypothetical protein